MHKVTHILLFSSVAIALSSPQITWQEREPGLSISQQIGDGIRNVPIPSPWYFLRNKYYWTTNTGFKTTTEGSTVVYNYNLNNRQIAKVYPAPDLTSKFNTIDPKTTTAKIHYGPYTTRPPKYQVPNALGSLSTSPDITSTKDAPNQTVFVPTYQPPVSTIIPSTTVNSVTTVQLTYPLPNEHPYGSVPTLTNAHSKPLYTSEYPKSLTEMTTEIPKLPTFNNNQSSGSQLQMGTTESQVLEKEKKNLENLTTVESAETTLQPQINDKNSQTGLDPLNYANNNAENKEDIRRNATNDIASHNKNPGLLFSGPQICRKQNAYFGVGENHSFYVECKDYQPSVKLCPENYSFDSNVQWPEYPCKQIAIENQAQIQ